MPRVATLGGSLFAQGLLGHCSLRRVSANSVLVALLDRSYAEAVSRMPAIRLHLGQWEARVLPLAQFYNGPLLVPVVVVCLMS